MAVCLKICEEHPARPEGCSDSLWKLTKSMLRKDPSRRPTASAIRAHLRGAKSGSKAKEGRDGGASSLLSPSTPSKQTAERKEPEPLPDTPRKRHPHHSPDRHPAPASPRRYHSPSKHSSTDGSARSDSSSMLSSHSYRSASSLSLGLQKGDASAHNASVSPPPSRSIGSISGM
eukprot:gnl/Dysnectes_brevis/15311_a37053_67.p1 GENE.gnl/Dysnectes_brevis/15311_a37053_67~~gnl/Dysnectes_brevis/15311_a37053_67.p1  ORF type:complete len:174 (-),score=27.49 gnl/Dysnectes_brevis/15311_a37053_67:49-570(-)